jgi:hypothetical protein
MKWPRDGLSEDEMWRVESHEGASVDVGHHAKGLVSSSLSSTHLVMGIESLISINSHCT